MEQIVIILWKLSRSFPGKLHRQDCRCDSGDHPDSCEDSGDPTSATPCSSGRRACSGAEGNVARVVNGNNRPGKIQK